MSHRAVIFDFDYTLADSSAGVIDCVNHSLLQMRMCKVADDDIRKTIGLSIRETYRLLTGRQSPTEAEEFAKLFASRADQVMLDNTFIFGPARTCIIKLLDRGMRLGIVTSKFRYRIEAFLDREALSGCFEAVIGAEDVTDLKPSPMGLNLALKKLRLAGSEAVYVGDSVVDAEAAALADMAFVAVLSGATHEAAFRDYRTLGVIFDLAHLPDLLDSGRA